MKRKRWLCMLFSCMMLLYGCDDSGGENTPENSEYPTAYEASPAKTMEELLLAESPEIDVVEDKDHIIHMDYSNINLGYVRIKRLLDDDRKIKIQIIKDDQKNPYYDLNQTGIYETFPMSFGSGTYQISIFLQNPLTDGYKNIYHNSFEVSLKTEQSPFLYPNQIVDYDADTETIHKAFEIVKNDTNDLQRVKTIYEYVVKNFSYDYDKSKATQNTYTLPVLDDMLDKGKGICFDYAAVMAAMCRSQQIPCRVIVGDTDEYHAWVEVWLKGKGWIDPSILFEAETWTRLDPTYASTKANYDGEYITKAIY